MHIREFRESDRAALLALWQACGLLVPGDDAEREIGLACTLPSRTLLVGTEGGHVVASLMLGVEEGQGWTAYQAAAPVRRRESTDREMLAEARLWFHSRGAANIRELARSA